MRYAQYEMNLLNSWLSAKDKLKNWSANGDYLSETIA